MKTINQEIEELRKTGLFLKKVGDPNSSGGEYHTCEECGGYDECDCEGYNQAIDDCLAIVEKYHPNRMRKLYDNTKDV